MPSSATPIALQISVVSGAVGVLLLVIGAITQLNGVFFAGLAAGCVSLVAALAWRSELIADWRAKGPR